MSLKKLGSLLKFDNAEFFANKKFLLFKSEEWKDYDSGQIKGSKYTVVIYADDTNYGGDIGVSNAGETLIIKVAGAKPVEVTRPVFVELINPMGTVYGDYRNELSVRADGIKAVENE